MGAMYGVGLECIIRSAVDTERCFLARSPPAAAPGRDLGKGGLGGWEQKTKRVDAAPPYSHHSGTVQQMVNLIANIVFKVPFDLTNAFGDAEGVATGTVVCVYFDFDFAPDVRRSKQHQAGTAYPWSSHHLPTCRRHILKWCRGCNATCSAPTVSTFL